MSNIDKKILAIAASAFIAGVAFLLYISANSYNPNSVFCDYQIYRQADGTFELWDTALSPKALHGTGLSYGEAVRERARLCQSMIDFKKGQRPQGERVR
jgi:hypothetical protein